MNKFTLKNKTSHIIYALSFGGGESLLSHYVKHGDLCIVLTKNSVLEGVSLIKLPMRITAKPTYYTPLDYIISIPSLVFLFARLYSLDISSTKLVFHGFPFQFIIPLVSRLFFSKAHISIVYHQFKKVPTSIRGYLSSAIEYQSLLINKNINYFAVSPWVLSRLIVLFPLLAKQLSILAIPLSLPSFSRYNSSNITKQTIPLSDIQALPPYIIYGARIIKPKGHLELLQSLKCLSGCKLSINTLIFAGSGDHGFISYLNAYAKTNLPFLNIIYLHQLDKEKYISYLNYASAFAFPSHREAFPLSLLEAVYYDIPIFVLQEYIKDYYQDMCYTLDKLSLFMQSPHMFSSPSNSDARLPLLTRHLNITSFDSSFF